MANAGLREPRVRPRRSLEWPFQKPASHLGEFRPFMCDLCITSSNWTGIQAHLHLTQLRGEGSESNQIQQCSDTWHEASHHGFPSIRSDTSAFSVEIPLLHHWSSGSSTLHCHLPRSSAGLTLLWTLNNSMRAFLTSWMIQMRKMMFVNCWTGGIGKHAVRFRISFSS